MATALKLPDALLDYAVRSVQAQIDAGKGWAGGGGGVHKWQVIRALAYVFAAADSPLKGSGDVADGIRAVHKVIQDDPNPPDNRLTGHLADARKILVDAGADLLAAIEGVFGQPDIEAAARCYAALFDVEH